jgi:ferritin
MLSETMQAALNDQINMEFTAYYTYLSMSAHFEHEGLAGVAAWMAHHAEEEMMHAMKIYTFVHARRGKVTLQAIPAPPNTWNSPLAAFEDALKHEQKVTKSINNLVTMARGESDHATDSFLQWFVDEQVEEEEIVSVAIDKLKLVGSNGSGLYLLDRELAGSAAAPAEAGE